MNPSVRTRKETRYSCWTLIGERGNRKQGSRPAEDDSLRIYRLLEERLSERERLVLIMRYGLYGGREYTQREIAERLGISRSYISRIEKNALHRLREYFQD